MKLRVVVTLKPGVLDPQGKAVQGVLPRLGFSGVTDVRQGKRFELEIDGVVLRVSRGAEAKTVAAVIQALKAGQ